MNITSELYNHILSHCEANNITTDCRFACLADTNEFWSHNVPFSTDCISYEVDKCENLTQFITDYIDTLWEYCAPPCNRIAFYLEDIIDMGDWYEIVMGGALFEEEQTMDQYTMTEQAYKNGYNAALKELAERLKAEYKGIDETYHQIYYSSLVAAVDDIAKELVKE